MYLNIISLFTNYMYKYYTPKALWRYFIIVSWQIAQLDIVYCVDEAY
jgi:hypothetical protein